MNLAQIAMTVMLSMVCAIPCSQAEFTLPPFENNLNLQGSGAADWCVGRGPVVAWEGRVLPGAAVPGPRCSVGL